MNHSMVGSHSGLTPDEFWEKAEARHAERQARHEADLATVYSVLDKMLPQDRKSFIVEVIKHYNQ